MRRGLVAILATASTILTVTLATIAVRSSEEPDAGQSTGSATHATADQRRAAALQTSDAAAQPHPVNAPPHDVTSPTPHPRNKPHSSTTPEPMAPPSVGPYRPREHPTIPPDWQQQVEEFDVLAEIGHKNLATGTKRLVRDVETGAVEPARATRIALAKMGYLHPRGVPQRYRGVVTQYDYFALTYAVEVVGPTLSDAERERIGAEVDAYVYGGSAPAIP